HRPEVRGATVRSIPGACSGAGEGGGGLAGAAGQPGQGDRVHVIVVAHDLPAARVRGGSAGRCRRRDEAELLKHQEPVVHQVEGNVLAIAEAEHLKVIDRDGAAGGRDVPGRAVEHAVVRPGEGAFLDGNIAGDVQGVNLDVCVGEGAEPAGE